MNLYLVNIKTACYISTSYVVEEVEKKGKQSIEVLESYVEKPCSLINCDRFFGVAQDRLGKRAGKAKLIGVALFVDRCL